ncbi:MAG: hypothetical protein M5U34_31390 [Chloroflexi bacterium]|nr:hypothetical protein [Chloroflexota bacterium]
MVVLLSLIVQTTPRPRRPQTAELPRPPLPLMELPTNRPYPLGNDSFSPSASPTSIPRQPPPLFLQDHPVRPTRGCPP